MIKILIDHVKVWQKVHGAWKAALPLTSEEILADCNEYCKRANGDLIRSSLIHSRPKKGKLVWKTPYAKRQYWKIETASTDKNPKATWKWCEVAKDENFDRWQQNAQKEFVKNL